MRRSPPRSFVSSPVTVPLADLSLVGLGRVGGGLGTPHLRVAGLLAPT